MVSGGCRTFYGSFTMVVRALGWLLVVFCSFLRASPGSQVLFGGISQAHNQPLIIIRGPNKTTAKELQLLVKSTTLFLTPGLLLFIDHAQDLQAMPKKTIQTNLETTLICATCKTK